MDTTIKFYNTLTRNKEVFKPIKKGEVSMYSCGPTVYSTPHIGNMRAYAFVDLLVNVLKINGYKVNNLINITDVGHLTSDADEGEDKLEKASKEKNINAYQVAKEYTDVFYRYLDLLNITKPTKFPKATEHIKEQIDMILELEKLGYTYTTSDGVYFNTSLFANYSKLSKLDIDGLRKGERVDFGEKINKTDFALWKFSPKDRKRDMEWDSPWGIGFPGWHIECSAMARKHLGEHIDIHTGGIDHIPVHHTNEIAQSEAVSNGNFVNYWMHVNFLQLLPEDSNEDINDDAEIKMSKSKGTAYSLDKIIEEGFDPLSLKYLYLSAHYRNELKFNFKILENAERAFKKLQNKVYQIRKASNDDIIKIRTPSVEIFLSLLNDDLDTPKAIAKFHEVLNSSISDEEKLTLVYYFDLVTGLNLLSFEPKTEEIPENVKALAEKRFLAKSNKEWGLSDLIRDDIHELGYKIEDLKDGYKILKI